MMHGRLEIRNRGGAQLWLSQGKLLCFQFNGNTGGRRRKMLSRGAFSILGNAVLYRISAFL